MLKEIEVPITDLCLDPNNPRFNSDLTIADSVPDSEVLKVQEHVLGLFKKSETSSEDDVTNIKVLYQSIITIGFVPIDRVVVRKLNDVENKYLVIEGNRRIATVKRILEDYKGNIEPLHKLSAQKAIEPLMPTFQGITCMLLPTDGLSDDEVAHKISIILGLRHHGSLLEWDALPKAYNIYKTYMDLEPKLKEFIFETKRRNDVASRLSISRTDVTKSLKTYVAFLQLKGNYDVLDKHYSLIQDGVTNTHLKGSFLKIDEKTYLMDETSLENMNRVCQFDKRDRMPAGKKKILNDPKALGKLGKLYNMQRKATDLPTKAYAEDLITLATDEDELDVNVDKAVDLLNNFVNSTQWIEALKVELTKQQASLKVEDYTGVGNHRGNKDTLKATIEPLKRMLGV